MISTLQRGKHRVQIEAGELISFQVDGHEYMHQKGSPGWRNTDTEMFPIIGPTANAGFRVQVPKGNAIQDQHGLLRELPYETIMAAEAEAVFKKTYKAGTLVKNSKFPEKSTAQWLIWPFDFQFEKKYELTKDALVLSFVVSGEKDMPFMLGYHPAFKLSTKQPQVVAADQRIPLAAVLAGGSKALEVADCNSITLKDEKELTIKTEGFGHFMLWTEVPNMVCIEPITFYPYSVDQKELHEGFRYLDKIEKSFKVFLIPG